MFIIPLKKFVSDYRNQEINYCLKVLLNEKISNLKRMKRFLNKHEWRDSWTNTNEEIPELNVNGHGYSILTRSNLFFTGDTHGQIAGRHRIEDRGFLLLNKLIRVSTLEWSLLYTSLGSRFWLQTKHAIWLEESSIKENNEPWIGMNEMSRVKFA